MTVLYRNASPLLAQLLCRGNKYLVLQLYAFILLATPFLDFLVGGITLFMIMYSTQNYAVECDTHGDISSKGYKVEITSSTYGRNYGWKPTVAAIIMAIVFHLEKRWY
jgi:hypothetical protein